MTSFLSENLNQTILRSMQGAAAAAAAGTARQDRPCSSSRALLRCERADGRTDVRTHELASSIDGRTDGQKGWWERAIAHLLKNYFNWPDGWSEMCQNCCKLPFLSRESSLWPQNPRLLANIWQKLRISKHLVFPPLLLLLLLRVSSFPLEALVGRTNVHCWDGCSSSSSC